jgi:predicted metal-dependent peptidase
MGQLEQEAKVKAIAKKVMRLARNNLVVHMRFMDMAINKLPLVESWVTDQKEEKNIAENEPEETQIATIACDGNIITYNPYYILQCYAQDKNIVNRLYLHEILHCTFLHFYVSPSINRQIWDLACDIAVENIIDQLATTEDYLIVEQNPERQSQFEKIRKGAKFLTAEKIYRYLLDVKPSLEEIMLLKNMFTVDEHEIWYEDFNKAPQEMQNQNDSPDNGHTMDQQQEDLPEDADDENRKEKHGKDDVDSKDKRQEQGSKNKEQPNEKDINKKMKDSLQEWEDISKHMELDLETFSKEKGDSVGDLLLNIKAVTREKYDYSQFLKKFASIGEKMMIDDDEFDYIYYTYGLSMYKNMPLIEPLEYKETQLIKEFVIAIDTSFSVHGDEVMAFIKKTYNILKSNESFAQKINLHIIQCDVKIQHDEKITTQAELDRYMANMLLYGFGGTDFRPVFEYVDKLIEDREFQNLKGLIYFTDGYGTFPQRAPKYKTAFAFLSDDVTFDPVVPPWAIKLILDPEDLKEENN